MEMEQVKAAGTNFERAEFASPNFDRVSFAVRLVPDAKKNDLVL